MSTEHRGLVVAARSREFTLLAEGEQVSARVPNRLRFENPGFVDPVAVGDVVVFVMEHGSGVIREVRPRRNALFRSGAGKRPVKQLVASNLDQIVVVLAAASPAWKPATLDRYLVLASTAEIPARVLLNKIDLDPSILESTELAVYPRLGVPVAFVSAVSGEGIETLAASLAGTSVVFLGPSGAGKSSLVNRLAPAAFLRVSAVSGATRKGRHTTSWVEMIDLPGGGRLVDSPGLRLLDLSSVDPGELGSHFQEIAGREGNCRFPDCAHLAEPGCAVKEAVESGEMAPHRYDSYRRIAESLRRGEG